MIDKQDYEMIMRDAVASAVFWKLLWIKKGLKDPATVKFCAQVAYVHADAMMAARDPAKAR